MSLTKLTLEGLLTQIEANNLLEHMTTRVELKASWDQAHGRDISALANHEPFDGGWLVIGVSDSGELLNRDERWLKQTEQQVLNHINQYLSPHWAVRETRCHTVRNAGVITLDIINPGEVVMWNNKAYKLHGGGTSSSEMSPDEELSLSLRLPGEDFSKTEWNGEVSGALVFDFAKKVKEAFPEDHLGDISQLSPKDVLSKLQILGRTAARVLFGDNPVRVVHFDMNGDILDQREVPGTYSILNDNFISEIQSWTRTQGSRLRGQSLSALQETPYPINALREVLANAVAHALYARENGRVVVEMHPNRLTVTNNCALESKAFVNKWFSRASNVKNRLLMATLRTARIADELGSGKSRIFRQMIESGRREPIMEFQDLGRIGRIGVTLYNEETNTTLVQLNQRFQSMFQTADHWRLATALVLWRDRKWSDIRQMLDPHYERIALEVIRSEKSPVIVVDDRIFLRRWAEVQLTGQQSKTFARSEEEQIKTILKSYAFSENRNGHISTDEARRIIGLSKSQSETTQLSNLFRKWSQDHIIKMEKRGHWRFNTEVQHTTEVIMMALEALRDAAKAVSEKNEG